MALSRNQALEVTLAITDRDRMDLLLLILVLVQAQVLALILVPLDPELRTTAHLAQALVAPASVARQRVNPDHRALHLAGLSSVAPLPMNPGLRALLTVDLETGPGDLCLVQDQASRPR